MIIAAIARLKIIFWTVSMISLARFRPVQMLKTNKNPNWHSQSCRTRPSHLYSLNLKQEAAIIFIFLVIYLKAMNLTGQNDQATDPVGWTLSIDWTLF